MALSLEKNQSISLTKEVPGLSHVRIGLGWEVSSAPLDLDGTIFMLDSNGKCPNEGSFVFFGQLKSADGSVVHNGDNRTGAGDGDDEVIDIDLNKVSSNINEISVAVTIYQAKQKNQDFGTLKSAYISVSNKDSGVVIAQYDLDENFPGKYSVQVGSLVRDGKGGWDFQAVGIGYEKELRDFAAIYGLSL